MGFPTFGELGIPDKIVRTFLQAKNHVHFYCNHVRTKLVFDRTCQITSGHFMLFDVVSSSSVTVLLCCRHHLMTRT